MNDPPPSDAAREARGEPASGFPLPPSQPGPARETWRDHLDHWKAELDYRKTVSEKEKIQIEFAKIQVEERKIAAQWRIESSKTAFEYAKAAIGHAILINGGAAIAILAHLGTAKNDGAPRIPATLLVLPLKLLGAGLVCACLSGATAYVSQLAFTDHHNRTAEIVRGIAVLSWFGSIGSFAYAVWLAAQAIR